MTALRTIHAQIDNHSRGGAPRLARCGYRPVRVIDLRGQGTHRNRAGARCSGPNGLIFGIGCGANRPVAINQYRRKGAFQCFTERLPSHFQNLRIYDPEAICGEVVSAQFHGGEIQNV